MSSAEGYVVPDGATLQPINGDLVTNAFNVTATAAPTEWTPKYKGLYDFSLEYVKVHGYIACAVCLWGIAANIANIVVLTRKKMVSSTNMILMWLAVADLLTMSSYLPVSIHFYIMKDPALPFPATKYHGWIRFMLFHISFTVVCHTIAIWLTIILAIFRYLFICYPTKGSTWCSIPRTKLAIAAVYLSTAVICIPNYLITSIVKSQQVVQLTETHHNHTNASVAPSSSEQVSGAVTFDYYEFDDSPLSKPFLNTFNYWIQAFLIKLLPCFLLTVLTILLILAMHEANKRRMKLKSQGRKDESDRAREHNRTTGMLLAIVGLFLLTELPQGILTLCSIFISNFFREVYWPLGDLLDIMALLNNSINFVLYCTMSRQFRDTFMDVFCQCCPKTRPGWLRLKTFTVTAAESTTVTTTASGKPKIANSNGRTVCV